MHPAYSVIAFTTASGAGFGLLIWLALLGMLGSVPPDSGLGLVGVASALALITAGLLSSTAHLGRPERAWRAFSQWRTSWLSREGVLAVATYIPAGLLALGWILLGRLDWPVRRHGAADHRRRARHAARHRHDLRLAAHHPQWHQPLTAPIYIALGLASGAVLLNLLLQCFGIARAGISWLTVVCLVAAAALKWAYWLAIDGELRTYTVEAATGLVRSARCARWSHRTPSPTSSCARWVTGLPASTPGGCATWRCCSPSPCPPPLPC